MTSASEIERVVVRMYRQLLGDCFLIRIEESGGDTRHILIDCGLLQGLKDSAERMRSIAADILATCDGRLDLVVITHEHWDHISGFAQARELLLDPERLEIGALWMAWTENPADAQANALRARFERRGLALAAFAAAGGGALLDGLERFIGPRDMEGATEGSAFGAAPTGRLTGRRILDELKRNAGDGRVRYLEPGAVVETPGKAPLEVAVLAPPRNEQRLFKDLPSRGAAKETYLDEEILGRSLAGHGDGPGTPFAAKYSAGLDTASVQAADGTAGDTSAVGSLPRRLHDRYFAANDAGSGQPQSFRRIDGDWSASAASLALKLDNDTNNTSLVLAFRLPDDSFLLFAADAQVGNWLSWQDQDYGFATGRLCADDILARTRLYKVGHHGSHNGTLRVHGLEQMRHPDLVAMLSTVEAEARAQGRGRDGRGEGWRMPDPDVLAALVERTAGRVVFGDRRWRDHHDERRFGAQQAFAAALDEDSGLFVEFLAFDRHGAAAAANVDDGEGGRK